MYCQIEKNIIYNVCGGLCCLWFQASTGSLGESLPWEMPGHCELRKLSVHFKDGYFFFKVEVSLCSSVWPGLESQRYVLAPASGVLGLTVCTTCLAKDGYLPGKCFSLVMSRCGESEWSEVPHPQLHSEFGTGWTTCHASCPTFQKIVLWAGDVA